MLQLWTAGLAGEKYQGRKGGDIVWHVVHGAKASLSDCRLQVGEPRLRRKDRGPSREVEIPAYQG